MDTEDLRLTPCEQMVMRYLLNTKTLGDGRVFFTLSCYQMFPPFSEGDVVRALRGLQAKECINMILKSTQGLPCCLVVEIQANGRLYAQKAVQGSLDRKEQYIHEWRLNLVNGAYALVSAGLGAFITWLLMK